MVPLSPLDMMEWGRQGCYRLPLPLQDVFFSREEFLQAAEEAFGRRGRGLDRELEACLGLAFY